MLFYGFILLLPMFFVLFLLYMFMSKKTSHPNMGGNAGILQRKHAPRAHGREV